MVFVKLLCHLGLSLSTVDGPLIINYFKVLGSCHDNKRNMRVEQELNNTI